MHPEHPAAPADPGTLDALRERIVAIDSQVAGLSAQRRALVEEYERVRFALTASSATSGTPTGTPLPAWPQQPMPVPAGGEWSGARVRGLLLGLGATLLAISALAFTAVAWSRLGDGGRAMLLVTLTAMVAGLAVGLRHRLPASAEALAGLTVALVLIDFFALRQAGAGAGLPRELWWAIGTAAAAGVAAALGVVVGRRTTWLAATALLPIAPELLIGLYGGSRWSASIALGVLAAGLVATLSSLSPRLTPAQRWVLRLHSLGCWLAAAVQAAIAATGAQSVTAAIGPGVAVAVLAAAPQLARRDTGNWGSTAVPALAVYAVPAAVALTLVKPLLTAGGLLATAVIAGGATLLMGSLLPAARQRPAMIAGALFVVPGSVAAVLAALPAVLSPLAWLGQPWSTSLTRTARDAAADPWTMAYAHQPWPAVGTLTMLAAIGLAFGIRDRGALGITTAAASFIAALAPLTAGASILVALIATTGAAIAGLLIAAGVDRAERRLVWPLLPGPAIAAIPATGWAAVSPGASVGALAAGSAGAVGAVLITRPVPADRRVFDALTTVLLVALAGVGTAAVTNAAAGGFAATLAGGLAVLTGVLMPSRTQPAGSVVTTVGAVCAAVALGAAAGSPYWLAGSLTALVPVAAAAAIGPDRRQLYGTASAGLALAAVWAWLTAAHVQVVEAYTAPAALLALGAGLISRHAGPGQSWVRIGPALVLGIGPTLALGLEHQDPVRLIVAAALSFAAVVLGAVQRLQAPLAIGSAALLILAVDQWGAEVIRLPRWITIGVIGVALMWIGATFERRRRDWNRASQTLGRFG